MNLLRSGVFFGILFLIPALKAQNTVESLIEDPLEELSDDDEESNLENEVENISEDLKDSINLNTATKQDLEKFPFLSDIQIENILAYLYIHGQMQTIYELQLVEEMDKHTIDLLLPFVYVLPIPEEREFPKLKTIFKYGKQELLTRLDVPLYTRKGYAHDYLGPSVYHSLKYGFRYGDYLQFGMTGEKDSGEPFMALHNAKGYDYYSFYFLLHHWGHLETLALGNYQLSFGQGLVMNSNFRLGKSSSLFTLDNRGANIRKHSSTDEYNYFRGIAATLRIYKPLTASVFYSYRTMDGKVKDDEIVSIDKGGLHRSVKEAEKRGVFSLQLMGGNVNYDKDVFHVGVTGIYYFFNRPYEPDLKEYSKYNMHGNYFYNTGIDYKYRVKRFTFLGEAAVGKQGFAVLNQLRYKLLTGYQLLLIHRYYAHNYWNLFGRSFGESSTPQNENGWYVAADMNPFQHWKCFVAMDFFSFPWKKYRISKPSQGVDGMFRATYSPQRNVSMYVSYRYKCKERDKSGTKGAITLPTFHHSVRYRLNVSRKALEWCTTVDYNHFHLQGEEGSVGFQFSQSCAYAFRSIPLNSSIQVSYFHTDSYDARVYNYERGLLYTFYTPSFYGRGFRYSTVIRYDLSKSCMVLAKFGQTVYQDRNKIGSGKDLIPGNKKSDLQVQLRLKF